MRPRPRDSRFPRHGIARALGLSAERIDMTRPLDNTEVPAARFRDGRGADLNLSGRRSHHCYFGLIFRARLHEPACVARLRGSVCLDRSDEREKR
jgi:hypothetical protein